MPIRVQTTSCYTKLVLTQEDVNGTGASVCSEAKELVHMCRCEEVVCSGCTAVICMSTLPIQESI